MTLLHGAFLVFGAMFGVWQVLLPDLIRDLGVSPGLLGGAISLGVLVSLPLMRLGGRVADRSGAGRVGGIAGLALAFSLAAYALASSQLLFVALVVCLYASSGVYDVAINAAAMRNEQATGRRDLPILHAAFSAGGFLGAVFAGIGLASQVDFRQLYPVIAIVVAAMVIAWALRASRDDRSTDPESSSVDDDRSSLFRQPLLLLLAGATAVAFLSEGAMEGWSAIYLRDALGLSVLVGASGVALFHGAMTIGRLATAGAARGVGRARTLMVGGTAVIGGMLLVLLASEPVLVLAGIVVVGLGLSGVAPIAFSLAGDASGGRAGQASSVITIVGYSGFLIGPGLIGAITELSDLRTGLITILVAGVVVTLAGVAIDRGMRDVSAT